MSTLPGTLIGMWCLVALAMHTWYCLAVGWFTMLIGGLVFFPVGVVHGTGILLGRWGFIP
ncbi:MAG: hypothetical protein IRZ13_00475 [Acetobacteraceae bacterium]|nr:hypothetical protein [Acetobacteraceae bacterium]